MLAPGYLAGAVLLAASAASALACGYCVEDKIAAVYDHKVVANATAQQHQVAFFAIDGTLPADSAARVLLSRAVAGARVIDSGSARFSFDAAALSVAFDPRRLNLAIVHRDLERRLKPYRVSLQPLRVMDKPAQFRPAL
jgi:hypothetical protein